VPAHLWPYPPPETPCTVGGMVAAPDGRRLGPGDSLAPMTTVLLATDADWILDEVDAALGSDDVVVHRVRVGIDVVTACRELEPELVVLDLQIGNMGGIATCMAVRHAEEAGRLGPTAILMLLDRTPDVFLARRSGADGWLVKPLDAFRLRRAASTVLDGGTWLEGVPVDDVELAGAPDEEADERAEEEAVEAADDAPDETVVEAAAVAAGD
jgi:DNA-binding response OmpR family regulator